MNGIRFSRLPIFSFAFLFFLIALITGFSCIRPLSAFAATLSLSPASGHYSVGDTFSTKVLVNSPGNATNAVSGTLSFDPAKASVVSISESNSVVNFWVVNPSFSNSDGSVDFEGVITNPGFEGNSGSVVTITFTAKAPGTLSVTFSQASVLANDGQGTNILTATKPASFAISSLPQTSPNLISNTSAPDTFSVNEVQRSDPTDPFISLILENTSSHTLDHYGINIDGGASVSISSSTYTTSALSPGSHIITATAFFTDGQTLSSSITANVSPLATPDIVQYSRNLTVNDYFTVSGTAIPDVAVNIYLRDQSGKVISEQDVTADPQGQFYVIWPTKLSVGMYTLSVRAVDSRGAQSLPPPGMQVLVEQSTLQAWGGNIMTFATIGIMVLIVLFALVVMALYLWRVIVGMRRRVVKDIARSEASVHKAFEVIRDDIEKHIEALTTARSRRALTDEESRFLKQMKKDLADTEHLIGGKMKDIGRDVGDRDN